MSGSGAGDWLDDTYWYVPTAYLPAAYAINSSTPIVATVADQTVWHFDTFANGYIDGICAANVGFGWSYMLIVGSILSDGTVKLSFSPLGAANPDDPNTTAITIGDGTLTGTGGDAIFTMQMTAGNAAVSVTHWADMLPITSSDAAWYSLPGYPETGVDDLTGLQTTIVVPCFARGTRLLTASGKVAVEELRVGMKLRTLSGALEPVIWIGRRRVDCLGHAEPDKVWPVCVRAGAFGVRQPIRDLFLSPDHALFIGGVLIPVKQLVDGVSILQCPVETITYYHVELATHDVVLAEGLPAETYLDTGDRCAFVSVEDGLPCDPNDMALHWEACGYAPLIVTGPAVEAVRRDLADRAAAQAKMPARSAPRPPRASLPAIATRCRHGRIGETRLGLSYLSLPR